MTTLENEQTDAIYHAAYMKDSIKFPFFIAIPRHGQPEIWTETGNWRDCLNLRGIIRIPDIVHLYDAARTYKGHAAKSVKAICAEIFDRTCNCGIRKKPEAGMCDICATRDKTRP